MSDGDKDSFGSQPWYRKIAMIVLFSFVLPTIPLVLLIFAFMVLFAVTVNYQFERRVRSRMRRCGRYLRISETRWRIAENGGTLIIENPSLGWNFTHAWWTPDDLLEQSPFAVPTDEDYRNAAKNMKCLDWDHWCWENYTCLDNGRAYLLRVWNGESMERKLKNWFPDLTVVCTWTALAHIPEPPESSNTNAA